MCYHAFTKNILEKIKSALEYDEIEIISKYKSRENIKNYNENSEKLILNMIEKRPCTVDDIVDITGMSKSEVNKYIDILEKEKKTMKYGRM